MSEDDREVETLLGRYRPAGPDGALRGRILQQTRAKSRWAYLQAAAGLLLIGLNLAAIGNSLERSPVPSADAQRTEQIARAIVQLDLPVTKDQALAMAQQLASGERLAPLPLIHGKVGGNMEGALQ